MNGKYVKRIIGRKEFEKEVQLYSNIEKVKERNREHNWALSNADIERVERVNKMLKSGELVYLDTPEYDYSIDETGCFYMGGIKLMGAETGKQRNENTKNMVKIEDYIKNRFHEKAYYKPFQLNKNKVLSVKTWRYASYIDEDGCTYDLIRAGKREQLKELSNIVVIKWERK